MTWVDTVERHGERCAVLQTLLSHEFDLEASELSGEFGDLEISVDLSWGQETCVSLEARRVLGNELTFAVTQTLDTVLIDEGGAERLTREVLFCSGSSSTSYRYE